MNKPIFLILAIFMIGVAAWAVFALQTHPPGRTTAPPHSGEAAEAVNRFACNLYNKLELSLVSPVGDQTPENRIFSPYSIHTALSMTGAGARGQTLDEMLGALGMALDQAESHHTLGGYAQHLQAQAKKDGIELNMANALFVEESYSLLSEFEEIVKKDYRANLESVDFSKKPSEQASRINAWAAEATHDRIQKLLTENDIKADTRLVLVNAIYFKALWQTPFRVLETLRPESFWKAENQSAPVTFVYQQDKFQYTEEGGLQILEIPYTGERFSMVILLPETKEGWRDLEAQLTPKKLSEWMHALQEETVQVYLPKFKARLRCELQPALKGIGIVQAFDSERADFSSMHAFCGEGVEADDLPYISKVIHEAKIEVDEKGTEASAATAVVMNEVTARREDHVKKIKVFRADHPFIYFVRDRESGMILFMGRLMDPSRE